MKTNEQEKNLIEKEIKKQLDKTKVICTHQVYDKHQKYQNIIHERRSNKGFGVHQKIFLKELLFDLVNFMSKFQNNKTIQLEFFDVYNEINKDSRRKLMISIDKDLTNIS
ncbi:hypothetical protein BpHYR1_029102 [Brachionus plicatilis]|uniref:Uncharacterized protein n=1 Tax=Brachionus plicatilis TaxID=10195 RepID=A0A3M7PC34_BRAPC|nr:hypothetical protein BpHYR1_029102 [Brachionus plicatilis]